MIRLCLKWRECGSLLTLLTHRLVWEVPRGEGDFRWSGECDQERTYGKSGFELGMNEQVVLGYAERDGGGVGFAWLVYTWEIQFSSVAQLCLTVCDPMDCSMPGFPVHHQLPELAQIRFIQLVMPSNHLILCHPLLLLPLIFPSIRVFSNESVLCIRWPKYWRFSFSISPSNEYSGLISFRIDWFDHFAVQGTLESLLQHLSSKASVLRHSAFFMVQLSHPYMNTGKTIALARWTFVG